MFLFSFQTNFLVSIASKISKILYIEQVISFFPFFFFIAQNRIKQKFRNLSADDKSCMNGEK